jgi:hypothetical protein
LSRPFLQRSENGADGSAAHVRGRQHRFELFKRLLVHEANSLSTAAYTNCSPDLGEKAGLFSGNIRHSAAVPLAFGRPLRPVETIFATYDLSLPAKSR